MKLLIVAAVPMELEGILARMQAVSRAEAEVDWARRGRLGENEVLLVANGAGWARASAAVDAACAGFPVEGVISTGLCGGLDPELGIAEIVVGSSVAVKGRRFPAREPGAPGPARRGAVISLDHIARTAAEKRELREAGGSVVEMESAGVALNAERRSLPFYCIRGVSDLAGESFINDFNSALRPDGHFDTMQILRNTWRSPFARVSELLRMRNRCLRTSRALGEFLADCRF